MPRKPRKPIDPLEALRKLSQAGVKDSPPPNTPCDDEDGELLPIRQRVDKILGITDNKKTTDMLFFVMYDIESNKVRGYVVKYLQRKGLHRVQKSIFLGRLDAAQYNEIRNDLAEVQQAYDNNDSILVVPISSDMLNAMKIIGQNINIDLITRNTSTLFF